MSDDSFSFTPIKINLSPTPYKSVRRHIFVTNDVQVLLAKNMSPFREQYTSPYLAKPSIKNELNIQQIVDKLDAKQYMTDSLNEICEAAINSQNLICSHQMTVIERSLLFQMLTLLIPDGLVIVISNFYILLKERLKKIKDTVSWAAINPEVNQQQIDFILSNIYQKGLQLLIIHPDSLAQVEISGLNAKLLVLDQANFYLPQLEITKTSQDLTKKIQGIDFQNIHILIPHVQEAFIRELQELKFFGKQYQIYRQRQQLNILSKYRIDNLKTQITSSRDEQPIKQLFQLLRGSRVFKKTGILVYVSNNQVENICQQMQLNGFRVGSVSLTKNEQVRQQIYYDFAANNLDIIVLPSGFLLPEGFKNYVYLSVHLFIPLNIESFLLDIYELNPEANSHIFLCDQYYFDLRNEICKSFIKISSIDKLFHEKIYLKESLQVDQFDLKYYLTNKYHHQEQQQESRLKKLLLSETSTYLGISKSTFLNILQSLEDCKWIEIQFLMPYEAIIYLNDEDNALTANIQAFGKKNLLKSANGFKCKIDDLARVMSLSNNQIINQLKQDNLKYEIVEEALLIKLVYLPSLQEMKAKMLDIYTNLKRQILIKLNNLDQSYILFKEYSFKSLDYMWKQIQLRDNDKISQSLITHLNMDKFNEVDVEKLPFQKLDTQREKSTLLADIKQIYDKSKPKEQGWIERENFATKSLMILMGLKPNEQGLQEWKSTTLWGKYKQFNYSQVHSIIHTWLEQQSEKECLQIKKKIKL